MLIGIFFAFLAGIVVALQSIFNTSISVHTGLWLANTVVHGVGFMGALIAWLVVGQGQLSDLQLVEKFYFIAGIFGVVIVFSAMQGIIYLGPALATALMLITQLAASIIIESNGWFNTVPVPLTMNKVIGLVIMVVGVIIFQAK